MLQACEGIAEAHALGIVHRDIKPSNFFVTRRPDGSMLLKILDFGISKALAGLDELTATQTVIGTPSYMAPEQMKSGRSADPRSDIWSIGVVMYQLLTGRTPFMGESYAELVLKVGLEPPLPILVPLPPGLAEIVLRCLEKDPAARYQDVGELARMLAPYASDPIGASQSAGRTMRILQQRGAPPSLHGTPLAMGGGIPTPTPISPVQLTPRSWPPSHSSVSHGAGQVTYRTRGNRGLLIAGVAALCILAGVGGYAISQATKTNHGRNEPHVDAPAMRPAAPPSGAKPAEAEAKPADSNASNGANPAGTNSAGTNSDEIKPTDSNPSISAKPADSNASIGATPAGTTPAGTNPTGTNAAGTNAAGTNAAGTNAAGTNTGEIKPGESNAPADAKAADAKAADAKASDAKDTRSGGKPTDAKSKPKPKKSDDLFDTRH
jgi:serine/threonine-protein kinase